MARKKHLINVHTSTGTTAPTGASLYLGEIAVQHTTNDPALWIKVGSAETSTEYEKFIGLTEITNIFNQSRILGSAYTYTGIPYVNSATTLEAAYSALTKEVIDDEMVAAAALNDLNSRVAELSGSVGEFDIAPLSASVVNNVSAISMVSGMILSLSAGVEDNELVTAAALNDLNARIGELSGSSNENIAILSGIVENVVDGLNELSGSVVANESAITIISGLIEDNELVTAAALNDLNSRIIDLSGNTDYDISNLNSQLNILSGAVVAVSGNTGGGAVTAVTIDGTGNAITNASFTNSALTLTKGNVVTAVKINNTTKNPSGGVVDLGTVLTAQTSVSVVNGTTGSTAAAVVTGITTGGTNGHTLTLTKSNKVFSATTADSATTSLSAITSLSAQTSILGPAYTYSGLSYVNSSTSVADAYSALTEELFKDEKVTAAALNDLNDRVNTISANTSSVITAEEYEEDEEVIAAALNDLNARIIDLSGDTSDISDSVSSYGQQIQVLSGIVADISGNTGGGGGSDPNAITGITMNSGTVSVSNRIANLGTVITAETQLSKGTATGTGNVVTDINVSNHQITLAKSYSAAPADQFVTLSGAAHNKITALSAATTGINATLTAHTNNGDIHVTAAQKTNWTNSGTSGANAYVGYIAHSANTGIHVTSTEKSTWNGKQDAISDLASIRSNAASGMAAYNNVNALSAATTAMSTNVGKIAVTGVTVNGTGNAITNAAYSNSALTLTKGNVLTAETLTGVSAGGTNVTVTNKIAAIPSASSSAFGVVKIPAQATSFLTNSNGTISVAVGTGANQVAKGSDFLAVSAATTSHTANASVHVPSHSSSDSGKVLSVDSNGNLIWITPVSIYTGSSSPSQSLGNDGDIYLQTS